MRTDLDKDLCIGCGEISPLGQGIIAYASHSCAANTYTYRMMHGMSMFRSLQYVLNGESEMKSFEDLLVFPHFHAYSTSVNCTIAYDPATDRTMITSVVAIEHPLDKILYSHARDFEVKTMKRIRAWIDIEEEFNCKY